MSRTRKRQKPADHAFEIRLSSCGSKIKLERKESMKRLSPNFQNADVIVLAVTLFKLAAVPWTKASLPHVFFSNHAFLLWRLDVHDWSCFLLSELTRNTCYSCAKIESNLKICLVLMAADSRTLKSRPEQRWFSTQIFPFHTSVSFTGRFSVFQTCQESKSDDYSEGSTDTQEKNLFTGCWITVFLDELRYIDHCFRVLYFFFTFAVKNSRFVFGQMDGSWLMLPQEEINSTVDWGPCLSLAFIRCWCWQFERTTCTKKQKENERVGEQVTAQGCCLTKLQVDKKKIWCELWI